MIIIMMYDVYYLICLMMVVIFPGSKCPTVDRLSGKNNRIFAGVVLHPKVPLAGTPVGPPGERERGRQKGQTEDPSTGRYRRPMTAEHVIWGLPLPYDGILIGSARG